MRRSVPLLCCLLFLSLAQPARAALLYQHGSETGLRINPVIAALPSTILYDDIFVANPLNLSNVVLESVTVGIRRLAGAPAIGVLVYALPMTGVNGATLSGSVSGRTLLAAFDLAPQAATATVLLTASALTAELPLNNVIGPAIGGPPGIGGLWIGVQFTGPNAADALNGVRLTNAPVVGLGIAGLLAASDPAPFTLITTNTGVDNFLLVVNGTLVPEPSTLVMLGVGVPVGMAWWRRQRSKQAA